MGLVSSIGLGVALASPDRRVFVTDGDGSLLMNLGSLATIARQSPVNLVHIVWDNGMWHETGGQPTHTSTGTDLLRVAEGCGIGKTRRASTVEEFEEALDEAMREDGPWFIHALVEEPGGRARRPVVAAEENLLRFRRTFTG